MGPAMLSLNYIQKGLLFTKPSAVNDPQNFMTTLLDRLKDSLALILVHFYPLAGRLATKREENPPSYLVFVDCNNSPGAKFIHTAADMTISDILSPIHVPSVVQSFFDHDRVVNHDAHTFIVDGTSFWHFLNAWSEIFNAQEKNTSISRPPILKRWFPDGCGPVVSLPFTHHDQFISRFEAPILRERIFHFSSESIAKLKAKANAECNSNKISSFQALSALVWRSITRAHYWTPLPENYFGNSIQMVSGIATAGELLEHNLGWAAWLLHKAVVSHTDKAVRGFNKYGNEFGLGKALALRSGNAHKFDGMVSCYPGREGGGSIDLEVCLTLNSMSALESNPEFMEAVSISS
ncbi:hypothetical protein AAG906_030230 [Vitis piasezkii]